MKDEVFRCLSYMAVFAPVFHTKEVAALMDKIANAPSAGIDENVAVNAETAVNWVVNGGPKPEWLTRLGV